MPNLRHVKVVFRSWQCHRKQYECHMTTELPAPRREDQVDVCNYISKNTKKEETLSLKTAIKTNFSCPA